MAAAVPFELRSELSRCSTTIAETPVSGVSKGEFFQSGSVKGFALVDTTRPQSGGERTNFTLVTKAPEVLARKSTSEALAPLATVYFDGTNVTATASGNAKIGFVKERAATADASVLIEFDGHIAV